MFKPTPKLGGSKPKTFVVDQKSIKEQQKRKPVQDDDDDDDYRPRQKIKKKVAEKPQRAEVLSPSDVKALRQAEQSRERALVAAPAVVPGSSLVDPETMRGLKSHFGERAEQIVDLLEYQNTDGAVSLLSRSVLQMLVRLLPLAESAVVKSEGTKGIYQMNQMVSSVREMLTDLTALRDKGLLGHRIVERTVRPAFMDIGGQIVLGFVNLEASARTRMNPKDFTEYKETLDMFKKSLAQYLEAQYTEIKDSVITSLS